MALPGRRGGGGLADTFTTTNNASFGISNVLGAGKPRSAARISSNGVIEPVTERRLKGLESKLQGQEQANRNVMDQLMKISQELKMEIRKKDGLLMEEKNARMRAEQAVQTCTERLLDVEDRLRLTEQSSRENKNALAQLISHTKNVERAVTMNQQDLLQRKEAQALKMQELNQKLATMVTSRENLERVCFNLRDEVSDLSNKVDNQSLEIKDVQGALRVQNKMFDAHQSKLSEGRKEQENEMKLSETQKAAFDAKIAQLQTVVMDVQTKLNHEKKEREVDHNTLLTRINECNMDVAETRRKRDADLRELAATTKDLATMGDAEKQRIIVQISAVQTELKRTMDERDLKLKQTTVNRLEEIAQEVKLESKQRLENEKEMRASLETNSNKLKMYTDESIEAARQLLSGEVETLRKRIQEVQEFSNDMEIQLAETQNEFKEQMAQNNTDAEGREKLLEAKIEDLSDRLRLGMGKLQQAIGESSASVNGKLANIDTSKLQWEDAEGLRVKIRGEMNSLEKDISELKSKLESQQAIIEKQLRTHQQQGEEASMILGDKLQQKMDSIVFTQERMKRQFDDLQDKTQGAPTEIFDVRERMMDVEREFKTASKDRKMVNERLESLETDVNHVMGRGETSDVSGIPTLGRLLTDIDEVKGNHGKLSADFETFKTSQTEKLEDEIRMRVADVEKLQQGQIRAEKRTKALKERMKKVTMAPGMPRTSRPSTSSGPDPDEIFEDEEEGNE